MKNSPLRSLATAATATTMATSLTLTTLPTLASAQTPLDSFTPLPTPGRCQDSSSMKYDYAMFKSPSSPSDCAALCLGIATHCTVATGETSTVTDLDGNVVTTVEQIPAPLTSFTYSTSRGTPLCFCEFEDQRIPHFENEVDSGPMEANVDLHRLHDMLDGMAGHCDVASFYPGFGDGGEGSEGGDAVDNRIIVNALFSGVGGVASTYEEGVDAGNYHCYKYNGFGGAGETGETVAGYPVQ